MVLRQPIYEKDRIDPVDASVLLKLDRSELLKYPPGYRHLAYVQSKIGYPIKADMPQLQGPVVDALYMRGRAWLSGQD